MAPSGRSSSYVFQAFYQACFLSYFDSSRRHFIIPPGTHCDILSEETIRPGERRKLFTWRLDECLKDQWGCVRSRPLPPGTYTIKGRFEPKEGGRSAGAESTFEIVAAWPLRLAAEPSQQASSRPISSGDVSVPNAALGPLRPPAA